MSREEREARYELRYRRGRSKLVRVGTDLGFYGREERRMDIIMDIIYFAVVLALLAIFFRHVDISIWYELMLIILGVAAGDLVRDISWKAV